jgi:hypothetical protein
MGLAFTIAMEPVRSIFMAIQAKVTAYKVGLKQMRLYVQADETLRDVFKRAKHEGQQALFSPGGYLTISDAQTGRKMVYDADARLVHLATPQIRSFLRGLGL